MIWLDCGMSLSDEVIEKFSSTLQANMGTVDKWIVSAGGADSVVPTITLFQEQGVDLNNVIMADCFSTANPFEMMMKDPAVANCCFGAALASAPPGVGMGMKPQKFLNVGDVVTLGIDGLGAQRQEIVAA